MTDSEFTAWLNNRNAVRVVLIEAGCLIGGVETTRYLSTSGYTTGPLESPANTTYAPVIAGGIRFTEALTVEGEAGMSFGDIELYNVGGERDGWLNDIWRNRLITVYIGDPRWPRSDFRMIFTGVIFDIDSRKRDRLNIRLRDKLERLNTPVSETKLGGTTASADKLIPLTFGDCHNVTPLLANPGTLTYQAHNGAVERIVEVRDNGVPIRAILDLAAGKFSLANKPFGVVTASIQGDKAPTYLNTPAQLIKRLATGFGKQTERLTNDDLDTAQLDAFNAAHDVPVGLYLDDRANVLESVQQLAASVGAQVIMSRTGKLQIKRISLPVTVDMGVPFVITAAHMVENTLSPIARPEVIAAVKLAYCRNWTPQSNLQTGIPEEHKQLHARPWLYASHSSTNASDVWKLAIEPQEIESLLVNKTDADAEALRRLQMWQVQRTVYAFDGFPSLFELTLGQPVTLIHQRFGLSAGKTGIVTALTLDWLSARVSVEVLA